MEHRAPPAVSEKLADRLPTPGTAQSSLLATAGPALSVVTEPWSGGLSRYQLPTSGPSRIHWCWGTSVAGLGAGHTRYAGSAGHTDCAGHAGRGHARRTWVCGAWVTGQSAEERYMGVLERSLSGQQVHPFLSPMPPKFAHDAPSPLTSLVPTFIVFTSAIPVAS